MLTLKLVSKSKKKGGDLMKKVVIIFKATERKNNIAGMSHPGCCSQDGGCGKKHG